MIKTLTISGIAILASSTAIHAESWSVPESACEPSFWDISPYGAGIGMAGLSILSTTAGPELLMSDLGRGSSFELPPTGAIAYRMSWDPQSSSFVQSHVYQPLRATSPGSIKLFNRIFSAQVLGDATPEIVIACEDGTVFIYDANSDQIVSTLKLRDQGYPNFGDFKAVDLDQDGVVEFIYVVSSGFPTSSYAKIFRADGTLLWQVLGVSGRVVTGQLDHDPAIELAFTSGAVVDSVTHSIQWTKPSSWTGWQHLVAADWNNDGRDELFAVDYQNRTLGVDLSQSEALFQTPAAASNIVNILVADVDGQPGLELLTSEGIKDGSVAKINCYSLSAVSQQLLWTKPTPESYVSGLLVGDFNSDGVRDVIGAYDHSRLESQPLTFFRADTQADQPTNIANLGMLKSPPLVGEVTGDRIDDLVTPRVVIDSQASTPIQSFLYNAPIDLRLRDIDGDGVDEFIVVESGYTALGQISIYRKNPETGQVTIFRRFENTFPTTRADLADTDGDGVPEIIATGYDLSLGPHVRVLDLKTGNVLWARYRQPRSYNPFTCLETTDLNGDHRPEAIVGDIYSGVCVFDLTARTQSYQDSTIPVNSLATMAQGKFVVGTPDGRIATYESDSNGIHPSSPPVKVATKAVVGLLPSDNKGLWVSADDHIRFWPDTNGIISGTSSPEWSSAERIASVSGNPALLWNGTSHELYGGHLFGLSGFRPPESLQQRVIPTIRVTGSGNAAEGTTSKATFRFDRTGSTTNECRVSFVFSGPAEVSDFQVQGAVLQEAGAWSMIIPAGSTNGTIDVVALEDSVGEGPERLAVQLIPQTGYFVRQPGLAAVSLLDNDTVVAISTSAPSCLENSTATFILTRSGDLSKTLRVNLSNQSSATSNKDYRALPKAVTIPANKRVVEIPLIPVFDRIVDPFEIVLLSVEPGKDYAPDLSSKEAGILIQDVSDSVWISGYTESPMGTLVSFNRSGLDGLSLRTCTVNIIESRKPVNGPPTSKLLKVTFRAKSTIATYLVKPTSVSFTEVITLKTSDAYKLEPDTSVTFTR